MIVQNLQSYTLHSVFHMRIPHQLEASAFLSLAFWTDLLSTNSISSTKKIPPLQPKKISFVKFTFDDIISGLPRYSSQPSSTPTYYLVGEIERWTAPLLFRNAPVLSSPQFNLLLKFSGSWALCWWCSYRQAYAHSNPWIQLHTLYNLRGFGNTCPAKTSP